MSSFKEYRVRVNENKDVPKESITSRVKALYDSGRYDVTPEHNKNDITFHAIAKKPKGAIDFVHRKGRDENRKDWYDPELSDLSKVKLGEEYPRVYANLKPDSDYKKEVDDKPTKGVLFRGMSHEEFHSIKKTGHIKSSGSLNLGNEQNGLTYYSRDPSQAQYYAHSFATPEHKASGIHHAYVVAVKDPGTEVKVKGTGENEVGIPHPIKKEDILHVHVGRVYAATHGDEESRKNGLGGYEVGSGTHPLSSVAWKKVTPTEAGLFDNK